MPNASFDDYKILLRKAQNTQFDERFFLNGFIKKVFKCKDKEYEGF